MSLNLNWDRPITRSAKNRLNRKISERDNTGMITILSEYCLLYTSDAADE